MIRDYKKNDKAHVEELLAQLQDQLAHIDSLDQHRRYEDFDKAAYLEDLLKHVKDRSGKLFVFEQNKKVIGCICGWITKIDEESLDYYPQILGYISDLFVDKHMRKQGVGKALMNALEDYFGKKDCDYIAVSYLVANQEAEQFYDQLGYSNYSARKVKKLSKD